MSFAGLSFRDPTSGFPVVSGWGQPRPYRGGTHEGLDFAAPVGTPVYAAEAGKVDTSANLANDPAGETIVLNHGNAKTRYMHLSQRLVAKGHTVSKGQLIAYSGASGIKRSEAHLHFDVRIIATAVPEYLRVYGVPTPGPVKKGDGFYAVPGEALIPANYAPKVVAAAESRGVSRYVAAAAVGGGALVLVGLGLLGVFVYRRFRS